MDVSAVVGRATPEEMPELLRECLENMRSEDANRVISEWAKSRGGGCEELIEWLKPDQSGELLST